MFYMTIFGELFLQLYVSYLSTYWRGWHYLLCSKAQFCASFIFLWSHIELTKRHMQSSLLTDSGLEHVIIFKNKKCDLWCSIENRKHLLIPYFCHHDQINIQEIIFLEKISLETSWVSVYPASPQLRHGTRPRFIDFSLSLGVIQAKAASRFTNIHGGCWILVGEKIDGFQNVFAQLPWLLKGLSTGNYQTQSLPLRCGKIISPNNYMVQWFFKRNVLLLFFPLKIL